MKSLKRFYSSLGLLILLNVLVKPLWVFAIDRQVQNQVGVTEYGTYFSLFNLSVVFAFLLDWGLSSFFSRQLAIQDRSFAAGNFLFLKLLLCVFYAFIVIIAGLISGIRRWDILGYTILLQVFTSLFLFFRSIIIAHQWFRTDAWFSIFDKSLMVIFCGTLLYFPSLFVGISIDRFLLLQIICLGLSTVLAFVFLLSKQIKFNWQKSQIPGKDIFKKALPFGLIVLLMSAHSRLDAFLLDRLNVNGAYQAGIYAAAYRLLDAGNMVGVLLATFLVPFVARQWSDKKPVSEVILTSRHFLLMFSVGLICSIIFLAPWVQRSLYHHDDPGAVATLQWCLPSLVGYSLTQVYGSVLTATGYIKNFCRIVLISALLNIILNLLLIPGLGAKGCCIAALISQLFCGVLTMGYTVQKLKLDLHARSLLVYIFSGLLLSGFFYIARDLTVNKLVLLIIATLITVSIMLVTRLINLELILKNIKNEN